jgi:Zn ribbon nucleic-acid-binding protein
MDDFVIQWGELKKRKNLALFAFFAYVPITFLFGVLTHPFLQSDKPVIVFAIAWMFFFAVASSRFYAFACPRCGNRFFTRWWYHNSFARKCVHCKLPKYSTKEQVAGQHWEERVR